MLLNPCLLIICLFTFEMRAEVGSAPVKVPPVLDIESVQNLFDLIRVELVQQAVYHDHAYFVPIEADPLVGWGGNTIFFSQEGDQLCLGHCPGQFRWLACTITCMAWCAWR